jgi:hypothetical protein
MGRFFSRVAIHLGLFSAFVLFPLYLAREQDNTIDLTAGAPHFIPAIGTVFRNGLPERVKR